MYFVRKAALVIGVIIGCGFAVSCQGTPPPVQPPSLSSFDPQVKQLLATMTLEEKIGQMIQLDQNNMADPGDVAKYFVGSVLCGGNSDPAEGNSLEAWTDMYDSMQESAFSTRLGIPILFGVDAVHGHNNVLNATVFPQNIALGCTRDPELVEAISRITAHEVRATGIQWTFAPCVAVPRDERWGRTYEGYSEDTDLVTLLGEASVRGLQGAGLDDPLGVLACVKHYIGDGGTTALIDEPQVRDRAQAGNAPEGTPPAGAAGARRPRRFSGPRTRLDQGDMQVDEETLRRIHLPPYIAAINAGAASIMPSYSSWNGVKCSASRRLLTEILKEELGFEGFLISDYNAIDQIVPDYKTAVGISINAGMDMGMIPSRYAEFYTCLLELVNEGVVPMERIDDAVTRILRVKFAMGLFDPDRSQLADRTLHASFGSPEHRAVARDAVRQSLVLLKNTDATLPLSKQPARIHVAGKCADDIGNQCGGWTVSWQGRSGDVTTGGTTILSAIQDAVSADTEVTFSLDGASAQGADVGIVIIGETPYAEGPGDNGTLALAEADIAVVKAMKDAGIPVVVVLISGRPMIVNDVLDMADAFVAAWLPGTEGQGVADVLFGDYAPTGKLSFTWPRSVEQLPINVGDSDYDPLFAYGFGLTY